MKRSTIFSLMLLAASSSAFADGFYVLGEVSGSSTSLSKSHFDNSLTNAGATGLASKDDGKSAQWRLQGGYLFSPNFALEAGYIDLGKSKYNASYAGGGTANGELKAGGFDVAALAILPVSNEFSIFGKAGVIAASIDSKLSAGAPADAASGKVSTHEVLPLLGLGVSYKLSDNLDLRGDFDHVNGIGKSSKTGTMNSNIISAGIAYHF